MIRARNQTDLLALLAVRLGFHPQESLLVASLHGPRGQLGCVLRVDLPAPEHAEQQVDGLASVLLRHGVQRTVVVTVGSAGLTHAPLAGLMATALESASVEVCEVLVADGRRWWSLRCADSACCDPAGTAYDLSTSPSLAQAVLAGVAVLPSRAALADHFAAVPGARSDAVAAAAQQVQEALLARWRRAGGHRPVHRMPAVLGHGAARVRRLVTAGLDGQPSTEPDDRVTGELAVWTTLVPVRDVAWSLMSLESAGRHARLWRHVARHAPPGTAAAPLALAGFASWLDGDGAAAWCAVEACRAVSPGYSMADLIAQALEQAVPPHAWTPVPRDLLDAALDPPADFDDPAA